MELFDGRWFCLFVYLLKNEVSLPLQGVNVPLRLGYGGGVLPAPARLFGKEGPAGEDLRALVSEQERVRALQEGTLPVQRSREGNGTFL